MFSKIFKNTLFFKKTICWILILAFLLQAIPDITQASSAKETKGKIDKFADWISKKFGEKILTVLPDEIYWHDDDSLALRISKSETILTELFLPNIINKAVEKTIKRIGKSKIPIVDAEGKPRIPVPAIPSLCELKIMPPPEEQEKFLTIEERRLLNEACYGFLRLKRAAANQIFFSRHLYNKTDPLSDCLMLNCRSSCNIRLGRINYAISYMDILKAFVPGEILLKIKKIIEDIRRIAKIWQIIKPLYDLLKTLPEALKVLADTVVHAKVFLKSFGNVLRIADEGGLRKALSRFADNIMRFGNAQSSASAYISNTQMDIMDLIKELQKEPGVDFVFQVGDEYKIKRERVQKIINDYIFAGFETPRQIIDKFRRNGEFLEKDGYQNQGWIDANGHFKTAAPLMEEEEKGVCYQPANKWLKYFKEFYLEQKNLADKINKNEIPSLEQVTKIIELKENLLAEIEKLPKISDIEGPTEEEAGETINLTSREYWTTTTVEIKCPGGELVNDGKYYFCRFNSSSCPAGWKQYKNWSTTQQNNCQIKFENAYYWNPNGCGLVLDGGCTSQDCGSEKCPHGCYFDGNYYDVHCAGHQWMDKPQENCIWENLCWSYKRDKCSWKRRWGKIQVSATITQIGCVPMSETEPWVCDYDHDLVFYDWDGMIGLIQDERNNEILRALLNAMKGASPTEIPQFIDQPFLNWILFKKQKKLDEIITQLNDIKALIPDDQIKNEVIKLIDSLSSQVNGIKNKFEEIKTRVKEIKDIWSAVSQEELDYLQLKRNYVQNIIDLINKSKELAEIIITAENEFKQLKEAGECLLKDDITSCFENLPPPPGAEPMNDKGESITLEQAVFYRFAANACPAGWKPYSNWTTTQINECSVKYKSGYTWSPAGCGWIASGGCTSDKCNRDKCVAGCLGKDFQGVHCNGHSWQNKSQEECEWRYCWDHGDDDCFRKRRWGNVRVRSIITQIGCERLSINLPLSVKDQLKAIFGENGSLGEIEKFLLPGTGTEEWANQNLKDLIGEYKCQKCCPQCDQCDKDKCQDCEECQDCERCQDCEEKESFLNQIKCFEEENTKTFREILIFIDTMIRIQKLIPDLELIRGKILAIQPQLNLDYGCKPEDNFGDCMRKALADNPLGPTKKDFDEIKDSIQNIRCKVFDIYSLTKGGIPMKEDGTPAATSGETKFYKFSRYVCGEAKCPSGWKPYPNENQYWSTTEGGEYHCGSSGLICGESECKSGCTTTGGTGCTVPGHNWQLKAKEEGCTIEEWCCKGEKFCFPYFSAKKCTTPPATITEIGCVPDENSPEYTKNKEIQMVLDSAKIKVSQKVNAIVDGISSFERKVFGDKKIRAGCSALDLILKGEPSEIEESCRCINLAGLEPMNENGQKVTDLTQAKFFRFNLSACPPGWKPYKNWSTTQQNNCQIKYKSGYNWNPNGCGSVIDGGCTRQDCGSGKCPHGCYGKDYYNIHCAGHQWMNKSQENCIWENLCWDHGDDECPGKKRWGKIQVSATITQIGCEPDDPSLEINKALLEFCQEQKQKEINERCSEEIIKSEMESLFDEVVIGDDQESPALKCETVPGNLLLDKCQNLQSKLLWDQIAKFEKIVFSGKTYNECVQENWDWKDDDYAEKCADKICDRKEEKTGNGCGPFEYQDLKKEINEAKEFINKDQCPNLSLSGFESFEKANGDYKEPEGMRQCVDNICREKANEDYSDNQRAIQAPCVFYQEVLQKALQNKCDIAKGQDNKNKCNTAREDIKELIPYCSVWQTDQDKKWQQEPYKGIPDLTSLSATSSLDNVREVCKDEREDLITTLEEIYDIYWILLGIKSGELFFKGLLSSEKAIINIIKIAKNFDKEKLKEICNKIRKAWKEKEKEDIPKSGLEINIGELIKCKSNPAVINPSTIYDPVSGTTRKTSGRTGSRGALVCPDITKLFAVIDGNFAALRQSLMELDLKKRKVSLEEVYAKLKGRFIPNLEKWLDKHYKVKDPSSAYVQYLEELVNKAKDIKKQAQMVWVLSSAVNFAAANCTCGQSFCEFPVCISNLSLLTPEVFGNSYCYVVYIFRVPLRHAAAKLERMLLSR